jgi:amino acid transporter
VEIIHLEQQPPANELPRTLSVYNGIGLIVGVMIGSGIFASPGLVLLAAGSVGASFCAWVAAGLVALMGSACYAELGTVVQESGGEYVYLAAGLSELPAFLFTWASSTITRPGSLAIIILVSGEYAVRPFYDEQPPVWVAKGAALALCTVILVVNCISVKASTRLQDSTTVLKMAALAMVSILGLVFLSKHATEVRQTRDFIARGENVKRKGRKNLEEKGDNAICVSFL